jgi:hypothetical protein
VLSIRITSIAFHQPCAGVIPIITLHAKPPLAGTKICMAICIIILVVNNPSPAILPEI